MNSRQRTQTGAIRPQRHIPPATANGNNTERPGEGTAGEEEIFLHRPFESHGPDAKKFSLSANLNRVTSQTFYACKAHSELHTIELLKTKAMTAFFIVGRCGWAIKQSKSWRGFCFSLPKLTFSTCYFFEQQRTRSFRSSQSSSHHFAHAADDAEGVRGTSAAAASAH